MVKRRRKSVRHSRRYTTGLIWPLVTVACLALIGTAFYASTVLSKANRFDPLTLCRESGPGADRIFLLDLTDPLSAIQVSRLRSMIGQRIDEATPNTLFTVGVVSEFEENWGVRFTKCKPETGADANQLYENPTLIARRYEEEFRKPVSHTLNVLLSGEAENRSPIMESLQALIAGIPRAGKIDSSSRIYIVSDMLQHSDTLSFYRREGWDYFTKTGGEDRLARNLAGAQVEIILIPRPSANLRDRSIVDDFWARYFDRQGSAPPRVISLGDL